MFSSHHRQVIAPFVIDRVTFSFSRFFNTRVYGGYVTRPICAGLIVSSVAIVVSYENKKKKYLICVYNRLQQFPMIENRTGPQTIEFLTKRVVALGAVQTGQFLVDCETYMSVPQLGK